MTGFMRRLAWVFPLLLCWSGANAEDYPTRPVKIIVPFAAGGPADVYARVLAQHLTDVLKQSFVVEDRPGAGSIIGTDGCTTITRSEELIGVTATKSRISANVLLGMSYS